MEFIFIITPPIISFFTIFFSLIFNFRTLDNFCFSCSSVSFSKGSAVVKVDYLKNGKPLLINFEKSRELCIVDVKCLKFLEISISSSLSDAEMIKALA